MEFQLPVWLKGEAVEKLQKGTTAFWQHIQTGLNTALNPDPLTCPMETLDLLAWERQIVRFAGEQESLYRLRVKHAFANSQDAGSVSGFKRIFDRLGVGYTNVVERSPYHEWDVVTIEIEDSELSRDSDLVTALIRSYGRTCRKYTVSTVNVAHIGYCGDTFGNEQHTVVATTEIDYTTTHTAAYQRWADNFHHAQSTVVATL